MTFHRLPEKRLFWTIAVALTFLGILLNSFISYQFQRRNLYHGLDTLFDSDPDLYSAILMAHPYMQRRHPLMLLFAFPFAALGKGLVSIFKVRQAAMWIPVLFGPLMAGAKTIFLLLTLRAMQFPMLWACLIALVDISSFSRLIVASQPESFGPTSTVLLALFYLAAVDMNTGRFRTSWWIVCGVVLTGITVTNFIPFVLVLTITVVLSGRPFKDTTWTTMRTAAMTGALVATLALFLVVVVKPEAPDRNPRSTGVPKAPTRSVAALDPLQRTWFHVDAVRILQVAPLLNTYAFTGPLPAIVPRSPYFSLWPDDPSFPVGFRMPDQWSSGWVYPVILVSLLLIFGIVGWFLGLRRRNRLGLAALAIVAFELCLHTVWGSGELYLYVLNWQSALLLLVAGCWFLTRRIRGIAVALCCLLLVTEAVLNSRNVGYILTTLDQTRAPTDHTRILLQLSRPEHQQHKQCSGVS